VLAPIASATSPEQCSELMASVELTLSDAERARLSDASG
jgi:aryl-alcohol dehydrogenase-like predicted oxidoreductase